MHDKHQLILCSLLSDWFLSSPTFLWKRSPFTYCPLTSVEASQTDEEESLCCCSVSNDNWFWACAVDGTGTGTAPARLTVLRKTPLRLDVLFTQFLKAARVFETFRCRHTSSYEQTLNFHMSRLSLCVCKHHTHWPMHFIFTRLPPASIFSCSTLTNLWFCLHASEPDLLLFSQEYETKVSKPGQSPSLPTQGRRKNLEFEPLSTTALILEDRPAWVSQKTVHWPGTAQNKSCFFQVN